MHFPSDALPAGLPLDPYDVVIPCYNRAHVIADAVESALMQDHAPTRVVVIDDGSIDGSADVIRGLAMAHPGVVEAAILPRNAGASNARNVGAALCGSPWIAFLDSDDTWLSGAAGALLNGALVTGADVIVGHFVRVDPGARSNEPECGWDGGCIRAGLVSGGVIGPSWSIVRRETVFDVQGFDPTFHNCNDWDFYTRAAAAGAIFARIGATVAMYRTVTGGRLVDDHLAGASNARRVLAHPYLAA